MLIIKIKILCLTVINLFLILKKPHFYWTYNLHKCKIILFLNDLILVENEKATYAEITDSVPQTNPPENKPDAEPYVSVEEMEALSGNLSPIRISREVSLKHQTIGEVYNATHRSWSKLYSFQFFPS